MRLLLLALLALTCAENSSAAAPSQAASPAPVTAPGPAPATAPATARPLTAGCLISGDGYVRARIRGAVTMDLDWHNSEIECEGGPRPNGSGVRVSFAGPLHPDGRRLRMVFGIGNAAEGSAGRALPTNLTVIFEGEQRLFATRGQDKCTVDELQQHRVGAPGGSTRTYRIIARGFCISPASTLDEGAHILVSSFDFAGAVTFEDAK
jgi:hypothetical protein